MKVRDFPIFYYIIISMSCALRKNRANVKSSFPAKLQPAFLATECCISAEAVYLGQLELKMHCLLASNLNFPPHMVSCYKSRTMCLVYVFLCTMQQIISH